MWDRASPARLVIADDSDLVREGLRALLAREPDLEVVADAASGEEAVRVCRALRPDLVLMDVRMPRMDGLAATREIKAKHPATAVLIVTTHESPDYLMDAIKAGAAGYVLKEAPRTQLTNAIRRALCGESPMNQELAMRLLRRLADQESPSTQPSPEPVATRQEPPPTQLTPREL